MKAQEELLPGLVGHFYHEQGLIESVPPVDSRDFGHSVAVTLKQEVPIETLLEQMRTYLKQQGFAVRVGNDGIDLYSDELRQLHVAITPVPDAPKRLRLTLG